MFIFYLYQRRQKTILIDPFSEGYPVAKLSEKQLYPYILNVIIQKMSSFIYYLFSVNKHYTEVEEMSTLRGIKCGF